MNPRSMSIPNMKDLSDKLNHSRCSVIRGCVEGHGIIVPPELVGMILEFLSHMYMTCTEAEEFDDDAIMLGTYGSNTQLKMVRMKLDLSTTAYFVNGDLPTLCAVEQHDYISSDFMWMNVHDMIHVDEQMIPLIEAALQQS